MQHRKTIQHYHEPGDLHELTFSCYDRLPLLNNDAWRTALSRHVDAANEKHLFDLVAFVFMPEHVHLLLFPRTTIPRIPGYLVDVKHELSKEVKAELEKHNSPLLKRLTIQERPGKMVFRYWQEGPGYDRNFQTMESVINAIRYIHANPVRRGLVQQQRQWTFSSARFYETDGREHDPRCPRIAPLPAEYFQSYFGSQELP